MTKIVNELKRVEASDHKYVVDLIRRGKSYEEIANIFDITILAVRSFQLENNIQIDIPQKEYKSSFGFDKPKPKRQNDKPAGEMPSDIKDLLVNLKAIKQIRDEKKILSKIKSTKKKIAK